AARKPEQGQGQRQGQARPGQGQEQEIGEKSQAQTQAQKEAKQGFHRGVAADPAVAHRRAGRSFLHDKCQCAVYKNGACPRSLDARSSWVLPRSLPRWRWLVFWGCALPRTGASPLASTASPSRRTPTLSRLATPSWCASTSAAPAGRRSSPPRCCSTAAAPP